VYVLPYAFFEVDAPMPETWEVEVLRSALGSAGLRSMRFEVNGAIRLEATATRTILYAARHSGSGPDC
jgi:hypothetical protein